MGVGSHNFEPPINQPMANALSLIRGSAFLRSRALDWFMFEGLKKASEGRSELCELVNAALDAQNTVVSGPKPRPQSIPPSGKVVGIGEARELLGVTGRDPYEEGDPVYPSDLFSPAAYKRRPELNKLPLDGMTITEYYEHHYEPKEMVIDADPGEPVHIDLVKLRDIMEANGMKPFRYGGFDGYMQYVEKGDYMRPSEIRTPADDNEQFGPDLTLDTQGGKAEAEGMDDNGRPTLHLVAGSVVKDEKRSAATIRNMEQYFSQVASALQQQKPVSGVSPDVEGEIKSLLGAMTDMKRIELGVGDEGQGRGAGGHAQKLFAIDPHHDQSYWEVPPDVDVDHIIHFIKLGLNQPSNPKSVSVLGDPVIFGPAYDPDVDRVEPDGWHRDVGGGKVIVKWSKAAQQAILHHIFRNYANSGVLAILFRPNAVPELASMGFKRSNDKITVPGLFNLGVKANPEVAKQFKRVLYTIPHIDTRQFISQGEMQPREVDVNNADFDPILGPLFNQGYTWELTNPKERELGAPDWKKRERGILKLGSHRLRVTYDPTQNKFFLMVPTGQKGKPYSPPTFGKGGEAMLAGGMKYTAGNLGGHIRTNPAGRRTYRELLGLLMNGGLGEPGGSHSSEADLPCVKKGAERAKYHYGSLKHKDAARQNFDDLLLIQWAIEGLRAFSGDPAFQVGYITADEYEDITKWSADKQADLAAEKGWGISPVLAKYGIEDPDLQTDIIQDIMDQRKYGPIIDLTDLPDEVQAAFGENAFEARVRAITGYVVSKMTKETAAAQRMQGLTRGGASREGEGRANDVLGAGQRAGGRGEWEVDAGDRRLMRDKDLRKLAGLQEPVAAPVTGVTPPKVVQPPVAKPASTVKQTTGGAQPPPKADAPSVTPGGDLLAHLRSFEEPQPAPPPPAPPAAQKPQSQQDKYNDLLSHLRAFESYNPLLSYLQQYGNHFTGYDDWKKKQETYAIYDPKVKVKDGCGFNWWGAVGKTGGVSITGEPDTAKSDPAGKGKRGRTK
jgi:hypothetical protein